MVYLIRSCGFNRLISLVLCLFTTGAAAAQEAGYPKLPETGRSVQDFVPAGWKLRDSVAADFNKDKLMDVALVAEEIAESPSGNDLEPRPMHRKMLVVLFGQSDGSFKRSVATGKLFGNYSWGINSSEPFEELSVRRNTVGVRFSTGGMTDHWFYDYYFRYQNNDWYLVGAHSASSSTSPTEDGSPRKAEHTDLNLLTGEKQAYMMTIEEHPRRAGYTKTKTTKRPIRLVDMDNADSYFDGE